MKQLQVCSAVLLGLLLGACNTNSSQPPTTQPPATQPPATQPPVTTPTVPTSTSAYEPNDTWDKAALLAYGTASSQAAIAALNGAEDVDWYKFVGKKGDKLEIVVRTKSQYASSTLDSYLELYPPFFSQNRPDLTEALASNDDATSKEDGDFGSKISFTLTADADYYLKVSSALKVPSRAGNVYDVLISKLPATP